MVRDQWYSETSKTAMDARVDFFRKQAELIADNTGPVRVLVVDGQPTGAATPAALTEVERCARIAQIKARILERRNA